MEIEAIDAGLKSRSDVIESEGYDRRIAADHAREEELGLSFTRASAPGEPSTPPASDPLESEQNNTGTEENAA